MRDRRRSAVHAFSTSRQPSRVPRPPRSSVIRSSESTSHLATRHGGPRADGGAAARRGYGCTTTVIVAAGDESPARFTSLTAIVTGGPSRVRREDVHHVPAADGIAGRGAGAGERARRVTAWAEGGRVRDSPPVGHARVRHGRDLERAVVADKSIGQNRLERQRIQRVRSGPCGLSAARSSEQSGRSSGPSAISLSRILPFGSK